MNSHDSVAGDAGEVRAAVSAFSAQSDGAGEGRVRRALNPYADLEFADGRRFQVAELRAFEAGARGLWGGGSGERRTEGDAARWEVEMEVQSDGRGDNIAFWVRIQWSAVRRGELERVGYNRRCNRETAIFLLAREKVWQHLQTHAFAPRFSSHQWPVRLDVE